MLGRTLVAATAVAASLAGVPSDARAGAWPQDEGRWLVINQFTYGETNTNGYDLQGRKAGRGTYTQFEFSPYIEYGVTPDFTLGLQPRFSFVDLSYNTGAKGGSSAGLAQVNLFARYTVYRWDFDVLSVQGQFGIPGAAGRNTPIVANQWMEYEARLAWGHAFDITDDVTGFLDTEIGARLNAGHASDQVRFDVTLGVSPHPDWLVLLQSANTKSFRNNARGGGDYDQYRLQFAVAHQIVDDVWLQLGVFQDVGGRNLARSRGLLAALWFRF